MARRRNVQRIIESMNTLKGKVCRVTLRRELDKGVGGGRSKERGHSTSAIV